VALSWILIVRYFISLQAPIFNIFIFPEFLLFVFVAIFFIETSKASLNLNKKNIEPPLIFAGSFLFLILIGTGLLLLPNATFNGITLIDALFTSTSAVCVTGLIVVDTATHFTLFGQIVILVLFQTGALGVMTFTSFFGFFLKWPRTENIIK
jgi:Trk-type K+ transport system membrane component